MKPTGTGLSVGVARGPILTRIYPSRRSSLTLPGLSVSSLILAGLADAGPAEAGGLVTASKAIADLLPQRIVIRAERAQAFGLQTTLQLLTAETRAASPGSHLVIQRIADLVLIQALRAHIASPAALDARLLHALSDAQIGAALRLMHDRIDHPWTVATLASEAGMSRSAFALRFKELVGGTPLEYLTRWRMHRASHLLRESDHKVSDVAQSVGYDSDGSFHKAFKRILGVGPGEYRRINTPM